MVSPELTNGRRFNDRKQVGVFKKKRLRPEPGGLTMPADASEGRAAA
jgi:hypothetical protein